MRPTYAQANERLRYDPVTGLLYWRVVFGNRAKVGDVAGSFSKHTGYWQVGLKPYGTALPAHCLAWLLTYGEWPRGEIDHRNRVKTDNRIGNLRDASHTTNMQNKREPQRNGSSGFLGVSKKGCWDRWAARIQVNGRLIHVGYFPTPETAHAAYLAAKRQLHKGCTV